MAPIQATIIPCRIHGTNKSTYLVIIDALMGILMAPTNKRRLHSANWHFAKCQPHPLNDAILDALTGVVYIDRYCVRIKFKYISISMLADGISNFRGCF